LFYFTFYSWQDLAQITELKVKLSFTKTTSAKVCKTKLDEIRIKAMEP